MALSLIPLSRGLTDALETAALELQDAQASYAGAVVAQPKLSAPWSLPAPASCVKA